MKMLMFDFRDSEREYFETHNLPDFEIEFIKEPLNEFYKLTENQLNETDVISVFISSNLTEEVLKKFKNLRIVSTRSTGYNHIDLKYCEHNHIAVLNVSDYGSNSVADYTIMLILVLVRKLIPAYLGTQSNLIEHESYEGRNMSSLTLGMIGCGAIGSSVARIAYSFGMKIYVNCYERNKNIDSFANFCSLDELLEKSDIITLHLPLTDSNRNLINDNVIQKMKDGVLIINTSRGELVDIVALYNNLLSGKIGGVALDVIECDKMAIDETPIEIGENNCPNCITKAFAVQKLLGMKNVIITPHIAYNTKESIETLLTETFNNIKDYTKGLHTNRVK